MPVQLRVSPRDALHQGMFKAWSSADNPESSMLWELDECPHSDDGSERADQGLIQLMHISNKFVTNFFG